MGSLDEGSGAQPDSLGSTEDRGVPDNNHEPVQGATAFGVYVLEVTDANRPDVDRLLRELSGRGLAVGVGELGCDGGAPEALGIPADTIVLSVSFASRADATRFAQSFAGPTLGVAEFVAYCRD